MDMDSCRDRLLVKIRLRKRDDPSADIIDSMTVTTIRHLSERKLASRDCSLRRAVLIQKALPFLETQQQQQADSYIASPPSPSVAAAEEHPWDRDPPCFEIPSAAAPMHNDGGIMLPSLEDDLDASSAYGGLDAPLLFHSSEERDHDWFDQECATDFTTEPMLGACSASSISPLSASLGDDEEATHSVVTASEQPEICLATCADSDEEEEEEVVRELFRKYSASQSASPASSRKQSPAASSALGKRSRYDEEDEDEFLPGEEDNELSFYSAAAQAEPLKCVKSSRSASPCGMTRRASVSAISSPVSSSCASFTVLSLV